MENEKTWESLFQYALRLVDEIRIHGTNLLYWTFGGGTVLMCKYQHRFSKTLIFSYPVHDR